MTEEKNKAALRRFYEQMDEGNLEIVDELVADSYVGHVPGFEDIHGRRGLKDLLVVFHSAFPDLRHIIEDLIEIGVDILNPVQPECVDHAWVKATYGDRLCFEGGVSVQRTLPATRDLVASSTIGMREAQCAVWVATLPFIMPSFASTLV